MVYVSTNRVVVISGPTGSGESSITQELVRRFPTQVTRLVTATTRSPRPGERDGVDYFFFSREEFLQKRDAGEILEVTYIENRDVYYGTYAVDLRQRLACYKVVIANTDAVGTRFYKEHFGAITIFIMPPSVEHLRKRLRARNPEMSLEELEQRIVHAQREIADESHVYEHIVFNHDGKFADAVAEVIKILQEEGCELVPET